MVNKGLRSAAPSGCPSGAPWEAQTRSLAGTTSTCWQWHKSGNEHRAAQWREDFKCQEAWEAVHKGKLTATESHSELHCSTHADLNQVLQACYSPLAAWAMSACHITGTRLAPSFLWLQKISYRVPIVCARPVCECGGCTEQRIRGEFSLLYIFKRLFLEVQKENRTTSKNGGVVEVRPCPDQDVQTWGSNLVRSASPCTSNFPQLWVNIPGFRSQSWLCLCSVTSLRVPRLPVCVFYFYSSFPLRLTNLCEH